MKRSYIACCALLALAPSGCKHEGAISPQQRVVTNPETTDFGLSGTWRAVPDPALGLNRTEPLKITMAENGVYNAEWTAAGTPAVSLRAAALDEGSDMAIVEVEASFGADLTARYMAVAKREGDHLHVGWIEGKHLAKAMHADGYSAVIEHDALVTRVFAEPDQLLQCVRNHATELIGQRGVFQLVSE